MAPELALTVVAAIWLVLMADVDRRTGRIPNAMVLPACGITVIAAAWIPAVGAGAASAAIPYAVAFALGTVGGGDVKLAVPAGGLLADAALALAAVTVASAVTAAVCVITRRHRVPHGPALIGAVLLLVLLMWRDGLGLA